MALRNILTGSDPLLKKVSRPITEFNTRLHILLDDLAHTLSSAGGLGLAAPQIGVLRRVAVIIDENTNEETGETQSQIIEMVNPRIEKKEGEITRLEGCLSFPGLHGEIMRPQNIILVARDRLGNEFTLNASDMLARAICHECDHLEGITIHELAGTLYTEEEIDEIAETRRSVACEPREQCTTPAQGLSAQKRSNSLLPARDKRKGN